jgi:hypothetical protein
MRRTGTVASFAAAMILMAALGPARIASASYDVYGYPPGGLHYGSPAWMDRISEVLRAVDSPARRSNLAEEWLRFSQRAISKNLEFQDQWLDIQRQQLRQDQRVAQHRLEMARLQMELERLRQENLLLERENLQMRRELNNRPAGPPPNAGPIQEPDDYAG